ncbi:MAG: NADH-quinone oxidoreductase subunit J [Verrucomicrobia bacterium]|nr:NADH-quinone oxidoreductase subunit J [Verrucomicrobiota bacterium]
MNLPFAILAGLTAGSAIAAVSLRNLVHCALSLVVTFAGLAALFLQLNAEFVGFAQILVYVGAVAILIVFAILLTRGTESQPPPSIAAATPWAISIAVATFVMIAGAMLQTKAVPLASMTAVVEIAGQKMEVPIRPVTNPKPTVKSIGDKLMTDYVLPLEVVGLLLTAAMIGAVIIAMQERRPKSQ